jgi:hypothetical protein
VLRYDAVDHDRPQVGAAGSMSRATRLSLSALPATRRRDKSVTAQSLSATYPAASHSRPTGDPLEGRNTRSVVMDLGGNPNQ